MTSATRALRCAGRRRCVGGGFHVGWPWILVPVPFSRFPAFGAFPSVPFPRCLRAPARHVARRQNRAEHLLRR
ncbi:hypothetical protein ACFOLD_01445 [Kocuria carniphila]|uniref:hypothetical protein n=1 Tax=Kocuria carniphila TaxID=262208 RepID=UPI00360CFCC7